MSANFTPDMTGYKGLSPFRFWCQKTLPLVYDDSLSYYELLCKVVSYINNLITDVAAAEENVDKLLTAYNQLQEYVNEYFDGADFQQKIDDSLDRYAEDGTLSSMVNTHVSALLPYEVGQQIGPVVDEDLGPVVDLKLPAVVESKIAAPVATQLPAVVQTQIGGVVGNQIGDVVADQIDEVVADKITDAVSPLVHDEVTGLIRPAVSAELPAALQVSLPPEVQTQLPGAIGTDLETIAPPVIQDWLDAHPEATTSVPDGSISFNKLATDLQRTAGISNNYFPADFTNEYAWQVNQYAVYQGRVYRCIKTTTAGQAWNASEWTTANMNSDLFYMWWCLNYLSQSITTIDSSPATSAHEAGEYFIYYDGAHIYRLAKASSNIAVGDTLTPNGNFIYSSVANMIADLKVEIADLKSANKQTNQNLSKIYDDGQLLTITQQAMLHPAGDGTFTISDDTITYQEVANQQNVIGFTFASEIGKQYTVSCGLEFQSGNMALYAVKGTTVSTTVYEGRIDPISESGTYSFTFTASTGTTTIWVICQSAVNSAVIKNLLCSAGWGYNNLDTTFTAERFPAQGKAVGFLSNRVDEIRSDIDKVIADDNLIEISSSTLVHPAGTATIAYNQPNGFTTNNSGNDNNLYGFVVDTQAKKSYHLKLTIVTGPVYSIYVCESDVYNANTYIQKYENVEAGTTIDLEFSAVTQKTSVWFNQRYNIPSIAISNIYLGDDILRYNKYIMDYDGTEFDVFNKVLCIGDSITEGTFNYSSGGSTENVIVESQYSYPTYLQKLSGCDVVNLGHGGYTAGQWYERYQNTDLSGYDACIIMLGINDSFQDVSIASFKANMTNIINKVMSDNKGIKVFVATIVPAYSDYNSRFDDYIAEIKRLVAEDFTDAFLIDINKYSICKHYTYYEQGHLTAIGYQQLAKEFYTLISYTIHNNLQAFRNVQFIGTDYTYPDFAN